MSNELIFVISTYGIFVFLRYCFFQGRRWLHAAIVINLILVSIFGAKLIVLFGFVTNVGNIFYAMVFFAAQLLIEHYGKEEGRKSLALGFVSVLFFVVIGQLTVMYLSAPESLAASKAITTLFQFTPRLAAASLIAFILSQTINIELYSYYKGKKESQIWLRSIVAHGVGQFVDSIIFFNIAFFGTIPQSVLLGSIVGGFLLKFFVGVAGVPFIYLSHKIRTREEILEEEAEAILLSIGEGLVMTDKRGKVLLVNKSFTEMLGWQAEEVLGMYAWQVLQRQDEAGNSVPVKERMLSRVLQGEKRLTSTSDHVYFVRKDGSRFPVRIVVTPVMIDNKIAGAVEVFHDITKESEIDRIRTDFLSLASHHLRTPLSGTRWLIETLRRGTLGKVNKRQREYLDDLYQINGRMLQLVSDMLNVLNVEGGVISVKKEKFPISKLCAEVAIMMQPAAKDKGIHLKIPAMKGGSVMVETDMEFAKTIIEALISNSLNYSATGKTVSLDVLEGEREIVMSVKDEGIGIPKEEQAKIFERFYRASNAKAAKPNGTGLGLYIASILAEKIRAKITFESRENAGSVFRLHLPKS